MTHFILSPSLVARYADAIEYFHATNRTASFIAVGTGEDDKRTPEGRQSLAQRASDSCDALVAELQGVMHAQHPEVPHIVTEYWERASQLVERRWAERVKKHEARKARIAELQEERERAMELIAA